MKLYARIIALAMTVALLASCSSAAPSSSKTPAAPASGAPAASEVVAAKPSYPEKPIVAIVAFNPGGGTDIAARTILKHAEKYAGTNFVVDNKPGAGGAIGWSAIATAPTDGYTIGMINPPSVIFNPITLGDKVKYTMADFQPIANFVSDPGACVVQPESKFKTFQDMIDFAKANPDELRIAYSGPGTSEALTIRRLEQAFDIKLRKIPFDGTGPMMTALMGDNADVMFANVSEIVPQYKAKTMRVLAVGSEKRVDIMPEAPTYMECGFEQTQMAMRGLAAPAGMDPEMVKILADAMEKTFADPEFQKAAADLCLPLDYLGPDAYKAKLDELDAFYRDEFAKNPW
ncbi:MAG: tripartite tricarboxylate transporter substrate binding protein [Oscillospiraceae bacterium]